jgi:MoxR-like ATPase
MPPTPADPWDLFTNSGIPRPEDAEWPEPPRLRRRRIDAAVVQPLPRQRQSAEEDDPRGRTFRLPRHNGAITEEGERVRLAVNAAIHLRRPLLITGSPGTGKTSLAYAIAWELNLGPVLRWPITPRSQLVEDGLFQYDAISRVQEAQAGQKSRVADYIKLGPLGTAYLPCDRPRVLLIDELDKADIQLPYELLNLLEEGYYEIPPLRREALRQEKPEPQLVRTADPQGEAPVVEGRVQCIEYPIVVMTSNGERDFPAAFNRRCIRVRMPRPVQVDTLTDQVFAHFEDATMAAAAKEEIEEFLARSAKDCLAVDQLLHALHLLTLSDWQPPSEEDRDALRDILYRDLIKAEEGA